MEAIVLGDLVTAADHTWTEARAEALASSLRSVFPEGRVRARGRDVLAQMAEPALDWARWYARGFVARGAVAA